MSFGRVVSAASHRRSCSTIDETCEMASMRSVILLLTSIGPSHRTARLTSTYMQYALEGVCGSTAKSMNLIGEILQRTNECLPNVSRHCTQSFENRVCAPFKEVIFFFVDEVAEDRLQDVIHVSITQEKRRHNERTFCLATLPVPFSNIAVAYPSYN